MKTTARRPPAQPGPSWRKRLLPQSLLGRSLLILVSPLILLQIVSATIFYDRHWDTISKRFADSVTADVQFLLHARTRTSGDLEQDGWLTLARNAFRMRITILPGARIPVSPSTGDAMILGPLTRAFNRIGHDYWIDAGSHEDEVEIQLQLDDGVWRLMVHKKRLHSVTTDVFIGWMVGASLILFAIATVFMNNQVRSIRRLAEAADNFGKGLDSPDFHESGAAEVRVAATAFKRMRSRIQRQIQQRTDMLAGVSHDLGTILTRMNLALAMLKDNERTRELKSDVSEMTQMIDGYLAFARGEGDENVAEVSVNALLSELAKNAGRSGLNVRVIESAEIALPIKQKNMRRALGNLIDNARRHAGKIEIRLDWTENGVEIDIDDDGPGISPADREDVFKPFYRIDAARNLDEGGIGLGLSIARDIVRGHGGDIHLGDSPLGGLRATVQLPA